jgi:hypothetical protein
MKKVMFSYISLLFLAANVYAGKPPHCPPATSLKQSTNFTFKHNGHHWLVTTYDKFNTQERWGFGVDFYAANENEAKLKIQEALNTLEFRNGPFQIFNSLWACKYQAKHATGLTLGPCGDTGHDIPDGLSCDVVINGLVK